MEEYQKLSDQVFDALTDYLEEVVEEYDGPDADEVEVEYYVRSSKDASAARRLIPPHTFPRWVS